MSIFFKVLKGLLISVFVLLLVAIIGVWGFLKYGLTGTIQQLVLPEVSSQAGIDAELEHAELDIFRGALLIRDLRVKNPAGFAEPDLMVAEEVEALVNFKSLFAMRHIEIQTLRLQGAKVHVVRNSEKAFNVLKIQSELLERMPELAEKSEVSQNVEQKKAEASEPSALPMLPVLVKSLEFDFVADYVDHSESAFFEKGHIKLGLRGRNLSTVGVADVPWGELYLTGDLALDEYGFPVNFNLLVAPFESPESLSFDLKGAPFEVDSGILSKAIGKLDVTSESLRLDVDVKARDGEFLVPDSVIGTELIGVTLDKSVAGVELSASSLAFKVPVSGTVLKPVVDWRRRLIRLLRIIIRFWLKRLVRLLDKAVRDEDKSGIQALGKAFGFDLNLKSEEKVDSGKEPEKTETPKEELSTEEKAVGGALRILEESQKEDGDVEKKAVEELFKLFGN